ncbi:MAG: hypothetical protein COU29_03390 [Candidatus Magasanikbacteria bacterium CG10_big_fil_rev_8_21_14_0_10_36_32]|uniref:Uncharacterized protein n=1 Tax=Candidatus Magasanikbacteria bacterium CG10_big_fil_rev_8_21_14_0_10_36_32 TaxID=1974646 RepID=A0A2M6W680_9BACT|nr:MAG: hypothetical protein COU29_03390 [Candidatus Magasanikbacteria bacterium CG10_big_fil_rev_8_21_14_0_10_36_32]
MWYLLKVFFRDPWVLFPLIISAAGQGFSWWYILFFTQSSQEQYFLHYNIIFGVDLVGDWWKLLFIPIGGLIILIVNFLLSISCYNKDKVLSRLFTVFTAIFQLCLVLTAYLAVGMNI